MQLLPVWILLDWRQFVRPCLQNFGEDIENAVVDSEAPYGFCLWPPGVDELGPIRS